jgi:hypothetical protein
MQPDVLVLSYGTQTSVALRLGQFTVFWLDASKIASGLVLSNRSIKMGNAGF